MPTEPQATPASPQAIIAVIEEGTGLAWVQRPNDNNQPAAWAAFGSADATPEAVNLLITSYRFTIRRQVRVESLQPKQGEHQYKNYVWYQVWVEPKPYLTYQPTEHQHVRPVDHELPLGVDQIGDGTGQILARLPLTELGEMRQNHCTPFWDSLDVYDNTLKASKV